MDHLEVLMALMKAQKDRALLMRGTQPWAAEILQLREALKMLFNLLEDYAPPWYGEEIHDKAETALMKRNREPLPTAARD
jgi:hypothetical protein